MNGSIDKSWYKGHRDISALHCNNYIRKQLRNRLDIFDAKVLKFKN